MDMTVNRELALKTRKLFNDLHTDLQALRTANRIQNGRPIHYIRKQIEDALASTQSPEIPMSIRFVADIKGLFVRLADRRGFYGGHWLAESCADLRDEWTQVYENQLVP
jgi:hypothetical protein